jgi:multimeric flavodoxin WrbA
MKVLGLSGSMRREGNTAQLIKVILQRCDDAGIKTEFVSLAGKKIMPCLGCEKCKVEKWCINESDDWNAIVKKVLACDVLVIGSPTYYYDVCGQLKNFIDRTYSLYHDRKLAGRKGVAVAVQANNGAIRVPTNSPRWVPSRAPGTMKGRCLMIPKRCRKPRRSGIKSSGW